MPIAGVAVCTRCAKELQEEGRMWTAMNEIHSVLGGATGPADELMPARTPQSDRRFSVNLGTTTVVEALTAVVRAHGSLRWTVEYCVSTRSTVTALDVVRRPSETMERGPMPASA
jgi:hypothetical protein